jgi:hypothetical protein
MGCTGRDSGDDADGVALVGDESVGPLEAGVGAGGVGVQFGTAGIGIEHAATTARTSAPSTPYAPRVRRCEPTITPRAYVERCRQADRSSALRQAQGASGRPSTG